MLFRSTEAFISENLPANIKTKLAADQLGIDLNEMQTLLSFKKETDFPTGETLKEGDSVLGEFEVNFNEQGYPEKDVHFKSLYFGKILEADLSGIDADILAAIKSNPKISVEELAQALDVPLAKMSDKLNRLFDIGALTGDLGNLKISKVASNTIAEKDIVLDIVVR